MKNVYLFLLSVILSYSGFSQCVQQVDFNTWSHVGDASGVWNIQNGGAQVVSGANTVYPTMMVSPDTLINVRITGSFQTTVSIDDDYFGFTLGHLAPTTTWGVGQNTDMDFLLFDWKAANQTYLGYFAQEGFTINDVDGNYAYTVASVFPSFWAHTNSASFNVIATDFGVNKGWNHLQQYDFELLYTPTRTVIKIDTDTVFDITGCFEPGRFGFYNYSQQYGQYWNFNYELYVDFTMQSQFVCVGDTARFFIVDTGSCNTANAFSNIANFYWDFGDGSPVSNDTNPTHVYNTADSFLVKLYATDLNGCQDTSEQWVFIQGNSNPGIGYGTACLGDSINFQDLSVQPFGTITNWLWDFGGGNISTQQNPSFLYSSPGSHPVSLIVESNAGCLDTAYDSVDIYYPPIPSFDWTDECLGFPNQLINQSQPAAQGPPLMTYEWDINNDGTVEYNDTIESHTFGSHGTYQVELKVTDSLGCRDSIVEVVEVFPLPEPGFTGTSDCFREANQFTDTSSILAGSIQEYLWKFGDGDSSTLQNPSHIYNSAGVKNIKLILTSNEGCQDSATGNVIVYALPIANFNTDSTCLNVGASFEDASDAGYGNLVSYLWDFGDGDSSYTTNPGHTYSAPGLYEVGHTVISNKGCRDTIYKNIRVYPIPTTAFSWDNNVCLGDELRLWDESFVNQVTPGGDSIVKWEWVFDNSDTLYGRTVDYVAPEAKVFPTTLTTTTNYGCKTSFENFPQVFPYPNADFDFNIACQDFASSFESTSDISTGLVSSTSWDFGDGGTAGGNQAIHTYTLPGSYEVMMAISSNKGCRDTIMKTVKVPETPVVDFFVTPELACEPFYVSMVNQSSIGEGELRYEWKLNGERFSGLANPEVLIQTDSIVPESFNVSLTAISEKGCEQSKLLVDAVTAIPAPKAGFYLSNTEIDMYNPDVEFINNSVQSVRWDWTFGDGRFSNDYSPIHTYENSGEFDVQLVSFNEYDCSDTTVKRIEIEPMTTLFIPNSFTPNGDDNNEVWTPEGFNEGQPYELFVYDRWGHLVFESKLIGNGWNGKINGNLAPTGSYIYRINFETSGGEYRELQGTFNLIR